MSFSALKNICVSFFVDILTITFAQFFFYGIVYILLLILRNSLHIMNIKGSIVGSADTFSQFFFKLFCGGVWPYFYAVELFIFIGVVTFGFRVIGTKDIPRLIF